MSSFLRRYDKSINTIQQFPTEGEYTKRVEFPFMGLIFQLPMFKIGKGAYFQLFYGCYYLCFVRIHVPKCPSIVLCQGYKFKGVISMAVPKEIRAVPRPKNTIVDDSGKDGLKRYAVRQRSSTKYVPGGNPQPRNGKVIGHIIDNKYVPLQDKNKAEGQDILSYGASALVKSVSEDLFADLLKVYPVNEAFSIMSMATLRIINPKISTERMSAHYYRTFLCKDYPNAAMSESTLKNLLSRIGQDSSKRKAFYQLRLASVAKDHHITIDGMQKSDNNTVNDLSAYSCNTGTRGSSEVSVIYALDTELMEPLCTEAFPGNSIDASSYISFIRDNNIRKAIMVLDKGFRPSKFSDEFKQRHELHFLSPLKHNDIRIKDNDMLSFEGILEGVDGHILYKKKQIKGGKYLYAYRDAHKAAAEEANYLSKAENKGSFDSDKYYEKSTAFGTIFFESDQDIDPLAAYLCNDNRWLLELVFRRYRSDECHSKTKKQDVFSIIGSEFVNFICTVATCRIIRKAAKAGLLMNISYGELMDDLSSAWRKADAPQTPKSNDKYWVHTLQNVLEELEALGLSEQASESKPEKRRRKAKPQSE